MVHERLGINSALYLPLLRESECIGLLGKSSAYLAAYAVLLSAVIVTG